MCSLIEIYTLHHILFYFRQTPKKISHHTARKPLTKSQEENYAKISELIAITEGIECSIGKNFIVIIFR